MDIIIKEKLKKIILEYIKKNRAIISYLKETAFDNEEGQIMKDSLEIFLLSKLYVFENALFALKENSISQYLGDIIPLDVDYNIEYIAHFEAIREINYEFSCLVEKNK